MASEPSETGSIPENLADDVPVDVDFTALMARAQGQLIMTGGRAYQANEDLKQKLAAFGLGPPAQVTPEANQ